MWARYSWDKAEEAHKNKDIVELFRWVESEKRYLEQAAYFEERMADGWRASDALIANLRVRYAAQLGVPVENIHPMFCL